MSTTGAQQVLFRTGIAAVNSINRLRFYFQDVYGSIRESLYEGSWANGTENNVIGKAKLGSPVAATSKELNNETPSRSLPTTPEADGTTAGWAVQSSKLHPTLALLPCSWREQMHCNCGSTPRSQITQSRSICGTATAGRRAPTWEVRSPALVSEPPSFRYTDYNGPSIRIWFQTDDLKLVQRAYDPRKGWYPNLHTIFDKAPPRTAIAATSFGAGNSSIYMRIYFVNSDNTIWQVCWDHGKGYHDTRTITPVIQGSEVAIISWGSFANNGPDLHLYFQNGTYVSAVSEWVWTQAHGSQLGKNALPPA
ncbi:fucose-specific lectin FleA [Aspergillus fischeri NRRL 181]|uniref:Fucose-specific lectin n=1 Tax=Neosartorya fischeri (strain ATCC 1020 / DSM 3700 / CBS 544.65 / FGSC A1164 / JCM 1740 / NRRL 181 / WB 181) TaxID=331117 RepID=A1DD53_NEOFI|nr:uncharacterized protein NFIA_072240 [Aspergillus fischeri NRRL 181]EAW17310.1 hypothetical protein NFIA_072240 [Aspergillus fischeri NRRL 181]